jgi:hypothetical protein
MRLIILLFGICLNFSAQTSSYITNIKTTNLPPRVGFELVNFNGKFFFMGGQKPISLGTKEFFNDIWLSSDGQSWTRVSENANWSKRANFNLLEFNNYLWIVGGDNASPTNLLNDVWKSADGINWTKVLDKGPWQTRSLMSVSKTNNKLYLSGGHSTVTWNLYQDIWESADGKNWKKISVISDNLLDVEESREGINEHSILHLNDTNYLLGGRIATTFKHLTRVLKSSDMKNWELATSTPPWKLFYNQNMGNIRPFVFDKKLCVVANSGIYKDPQTQKDVVDKQRVYTSPNGKDWTMELELPSIVSSNLMNNKYLEKPRVLINGDTICLYSSLYKILPMQSIDNELRMIQLFSTTKNETIDSTIIDKDTIVTPPNDSIIAPIFDTVKTLILEKELQNQLIIFPTFNKGNFVIKFENEKIELLKIYNIKGRLVYQEKCNANRLEVNLNIENGLYIVNVKTKTNEFIKKIVVFQ